MTLLSTLGVDLSGSRASASVLYTHGLLQRHCVRISYKVIIFLN